MKPPWGAMHPWLRESGRGAQQEVAPQHPRPERHEAAHVARDVAIRVLEVERAVNLRAGEPDSSDHGPRDPDFVLFQTRA